MRFIHLPPTSVKAKKLCKDDFPICFFNLSYRNHMVKERIFISWRQIVIVHSLIWETVFIKPDKCMQSLLAVKDFIQISRIVSSSYQYKRSCSNLLSIIVSHFIWLLYQIIFIYGFYKKSHTFLCGLSIMTKLCTMKFRLSESPYLQNRS